MTLAQAKTAAEAILDRWLENCGYQTTIRSRDWVRLRNRIAEALQDADGGIVNEFYTGRK